jgi:hypothetical protein
MTKKDKRFWRIVLFIFGIIAVFFIAVYARRCTLQQRSYYYTPKPNEGRGPIPPWKGEEDPKAPGLKITPF